MQLLVLGLNHNSAPLSVRERVAFSSEDIELTIARVLEQLSSLEKGAISELAILSTCNRTEWYCVAKDIQRAEESLTSFIANHKRIKASDLTPHLYRYQDEAAAQHAFRVASGLDSMVLGETQIVGQMKKAIKTAQDVHGLGVMLNHLFQTTFSVAKEVRSTTTIGSNSISLAAAAVRLSLQLFGSLEKEKILFIGAGEMIELCAAHFHAHQPKSITVANRTLEKGQALAKEYGGQAMCLSDLHEHFAEYDIVVSCTAATLPIIGLGLVDRAITERRHRPIFMVDLAVPRDIEQEVNQLEDVYVYTVDDLGKVVLQGLQHRQGAISHAEKIIEKKVKEFSAWLNVRSVVPAIQSLRDRATLLVEAELKIAKSRLAQNQPQEAVLERFAYEVTQKFLHDPTLLLRNEANLSPEEHHQLLKLLDRFYRPYE